MKLIKPFNSNLRNTVKKIINYLFKSSHKELKSSVITFFILLLSTGIYLYFIEVGSILFKVLSSLGVSIVFSLIPYLLSKFYGSTPIWSICAHIKKSNYYNKTLYISLVFFSIFVFFRGDIENDFFSTIIAWVKDLKYTSSIRFLYETKFYIYIIVSTILSNIIFLVFSPSFASCGYESFRSEKLHTIKLKLEIKKIINSHRKYSLLLLEKDKIYLDVDIKKLKSYKDHHPAEIYDILMRRSYSIKIISGMICLPLMTLSFLMPAFSLIITFLMYFSLLK